MDKKAFVMSKLITIIIIIFVFAVIAYFIGASYYHTGGALTAFTKYFSLTGRSKLEPISQQNVEMIDSITGKRFANLTNEQMKFVLVTKPSLIGDGTNWIDKLLATNKKTDAEQVIKYDVKRFLEVYDNILTAEERKTLFPRAKQEHAHMYEYLGKAYEILEDYKNAAKMIYSSYVLINKYKLPTDEKTREKKLKEHVDKLIEFSNLKGISILPDPRKEDVALFSFIGSFELFGKESDPFKKYKLYNSLIPKYEDSKYFEYFKKQEKEIYENYITASVDAVEGYEKKIEILEKLYEKFKGTGYSVYVEQKWEDVGILIEGLELPSIKSTELMSKKPTYVLANDRGMALVPDFWVYYVLRFSSDGQGNYNVPHRDVHVATKYFKGFLSHGSCDVANWPIGKFRFCVKRKYFPGYGFYVAVKEMGNDKMIIDIKYAPIKEEVNEA